MRCMEGIVHSRLALMVPAFLAIQTGLAFWAAGGERLPAPPQFSRFPAELGDWQKTGNEPISPDALAVFAPIVP